jgi:hypothetical protein
MVQGSNPDGGARFSAPVQNGPGAHPASYTMATRSFLGVKHPGRGVDHPPPSSSDVKERVELYLYSSSGPSWPVKGRNLPLRYFTVMILYVLCTFCTFITYCTSCCHFDKLWVHGIYVYSIYYDDDDDESELVLAVHNIKSPSWNSRLPDFSHIL